MPEMPMASCDIDAEELYYQCYLAPYRNNVSSDETADIDDFTSVLNMK